MKKLVISIAPLLFIIYGIFWCIFGFKEGTLHFVCFLGVFVAIILLLYVVNWWANFVDKHIKD